MKREAAAGLWAVIILFLGCVAVGLAEEDQIDEDELKKSAPRVFLDCRACDRDYIRTEITYVNFVRDRKAADIHLLGTVQSTGSGGREYTLTYIGLNQFEGMQDTLTYVTDRTDTWDETRKGLVEVMKKGFFPFLLKTPIAEHLSVVFRRNFQPTAVEDRWDFWVFSVSASGSMGGEESRKSYSLRGNFSANRVTPELKIRAAVSGNYNEGRYDINGDRIISTSERKNFYGLMVKSLGEHWSVGGWVSTSSSSYSNVASEYSLAPAFEFNLFPYSQSTRRELRFLYRVGFRRANYAEETIFEKIRENLFAQYLNVTFEVQEPWGTASTSLVGSHYFHDFSKNRMEFYGHLSVRLVKGLNVNFFGSYSRIHDQLSLPKGGATLDEILLRRKILATDYEYNLSMGLSYTFGSVYSNVVNPRFGH